MVFFSPALLSAGYLGEIIAIVTVCGQRCSNASRLEPLVYNYSPSSLNFTLDSTHFNIKSALPMDSAATPVVMATICRGYMVDE